MELTEPQIRVLGCLLEKAATTPDLYPLSTNALTAACNQKSNREPHVDYADRLVDDLMIELRSAGLARTVHTTGARTPKHKHILDEAWALDSEELAVLAILMLRGPNTVNELRIRTNRYVEFDDDSGVERTLEQLRDRDEPLVTNLGRQSGQREARWTHLLTGEPTTTATGSAPDGSTAPSPAPPAAAVVAARASSPEDAARIARLEAQVEELRAGLDDLRRELGMTE